MNNSSSILWISSSGGAANFVAALSPSYSISIQASCYQQEQQHFRQVLDLIQLIPSHLVDFMV